MILMLMVERATSNSYYQRAGWNIVERAKAFPNEPLPDPAFLRRDFESCVLEGILHRDRHKDKVLSLEEVLKVVFWKEMQSAFISREAPTARQKLGTTGQLEFIRSL